MGTAILLCRAQHDPVVALDPASRLAGAPRLPREGKRQTLRVPRARAPGRAAEASTRGQRPYLYDGVQGGVRAQAQVCARDIVANGGGQYANRDAELLVVATRLGKRGRALEGLKRVRGSAGAGPAPAVARRGAAPREPVGEEAAGVG